MADNQTWGFGWLAEGARGSRGPTGLVGNHAEVESALEWSFIKAVRKKVAEAAQNRYPTSGTDQGEMFIIPENMSANSAFTAGAFWAMPSQKAMVEAAKHADLIHRYSFGEEIEGFDLRYSLERLTDALGLTGHGDPDD